MAFKKSVSILVLAGILKTAFAQDCGSSFVAFGYGGANYWNCDPWIDSSMQPYLAWYNGTTSITHGGGNCNDPTVFKTMKNAFAIGGQTVPGNSSLDRSSYDKNPYYILFPSASGADIAIHVQSSSDDWYTELQHWELGATKSGDGFDLTGTFIGKVPSNNYFYWPGTSCRDGGDIWPNFGYEDGIEWGWTLSGHVSPDAAEIEILYTNTDSDGMKQTTSVKYSGTAGKDGGPRLSTAGDFPTSDASYKAPEDPTDPSPPPPTQSSSGSSSGSSSSGSSSGSSVTGSATRTSSTSSATGGSTAGNAANGRAPGMRCGVVGGLFLVAGAILLN